MKHSLVPNVVQRGEKQEIIIHRIDMFCESCRQGIYKTTFVNDERNWHQHKCTECGHVKYYDEHYPKIISTEL